MLGNQQNYEDPRKKPSYLRRKVVPVEMDNKNPFSEIIQQRSMDEFNNMMAQEKRTRSCVLAATIALSSACIIGCGLSMYLANNPQVVENFFKTLAP